MDLWWGYSCPLCPYLISVTFPAFNCSYFSQKPPAKSPFLDRWIKWQLTGREHDAFPVYQENFLRQVLDTGQRLKQIQRVRVNQRVCNSFVLQFIHSIITNVIQKYFAGSQRVSFSGVPAVQDACDKLQHVQGVLIIVILQGAIMIAVEIVTDGFSFQDYGVGQTAAEYINGAFNGQKGFKASLNHRNTRQMWDPVHPVKTFFSVYCWHCDRTFLLLKSPRSFVCYIFLPHRTRAMVWCV